MWGRRPERRHKCSLQRSLRCTCFTFICCLMHLSACLIEFIGSYILFGTCTRSEIVTSVFVDSPTISLSLIICVRLCGRTATAQTVSGIGLVFKLKRSLLASVTALKSRRWHRFSTYVSRSPFSLFTLSFHGFDYIFTTNLSEKQAKCYTVALVPCSRWFYMRLCLRQLWLYNHTHTHTHE